MLPRWPKKSVSQFLPLSRLVYGRDSSRHPKVLKVRTRKAGFGMFFPCSIVLPDGGPKGDTVLFDVLTKNDNREPRPLALKAVCGPGDSPDPVITIMLPTED